MKRLAMWSEAMRVALLASATAMCAQQPAEPVDRTPQDGQAYALMNQATGLQLSGIAAGVTTGVRDLTSVAQRWTLARLVGGSWKLKNEATGLCLAEGSGRHAHGEVCGLSFRQNWRITEGANGYSALTDEATGALLTTSGGEVTAEEAGTPGQAQLWQLRPAFWRGADVAEQEKMEAIRVRTGLPWWKDADQPEDMLKILKDHGFNSIRIRPTSIPPYYPNQPATMCTGNFCYIETDAQDLDLARRARALGFSVELTLLFDGGSSQSTPGSWVGESQAQLATSVYNYTKAELEMYRQAGLMPDLVSIGNEVDNGFLGGPGYYTYDHFAAFAALEKAGLTAVADAAADTSLGPALPRPLTCIHITPQYDMTSFFTSANASGLAYDAICQSYYPFFHGPLTQAQANQTNPNKQPVEAAALLKAAQTIGKPIFIMETAEHYEPGFSYLDPWYGGTRAGQRQYLLDLEAVVKSLPNNLGMGLQYWAPNDVQMPDGGGPYSTFQKDYTTPDALFAWEGLGLFDSADPSYLTDSTAANYSTALPGLDAVGGKLDPALTYRLQKRGSVELLGGFGGVAGTNLFSAFTPLTGAVDTVFQWRIVSDHRGTFTVANIHATGSGAPVVLDGSGSGGGAILKVAATGSTSQSWDVQTAGDGFFYLVNQFTGMVLELNNNGDAVTVPMSSAGQEAQWSITPVAISTGS